MTPAEIAKMEELGYTGVYTITGRRTHLLSSTESPNSYADAECGAERNWEDGVWEGTGSEREYEKAKQMPLCQHCARRAFT